MRSLLFGCCLLLLSQRAAAGQPVAAAGGLVLPLFQSGTTYESSYLPPFPSTPHTGTAGQTLTLDPGFRPGFWGSLEWFPSAHVGLSFRGAFRESGLEGANTPYHVSLKYTARQPPDYVAREYQYDRATSWPDTTGELDTWSVDIETQWASGPAARPRFHLGGGLALVGISGSFQPVGLTTFQLGGHSVLFPNEYQTVLGIDRTWTATLVASGGVTIPFGAHAGLVLSGRILVPRTISADVRVLTVNGDTAVVAMTAEEAQRALAPSPLELRLKTAEVLVGIRIHP